MVAMAKIEVRAMQAYSALDLCLEIWREWQRSNHMNVGWHRRSAMLASEGGNDSESLYDGMDIATAEAVEAMMADLPRHLDWAIRRQCGIATVWRFPNLDFGVALEEARGTLEKKLKNNVATRSFFF